jgi:hypothetical protein
VAARSEVAAELNKSILIAFRPRNPWATPWLRYRKLNKTDFQIQERVIQRPKMSQTSWWV